MFKYPQKYVIDVLFLLVCLSVPACCLMESYRPTPVPCPPYPVVQVPAQEVWRGVTPDMP